MSYYIAYIFSLESQNYIKMISWIRVLIQMIGFMAKILDI